MAQFFYDFKDMLPGFRAPSGLVGGIPENDTNLRQEFQKSFDGMIDSVRLKAMGSVWGSPQCSYGPNVQATDVECLVKLNANFQSGVYYGNSGPTLYARRSTHPSATVGNNYELALETNPSAMGSFMRKSVGGSHTDIAGGAVTSGGVDRGSSVPAWIRFQVSGPNLRIKAWLDSVSEPVAWGREATDTSLTGAGWFSFGIPHAGVGSASLASGRQYSIYMLSFGTDGDAAPSSPMLRTVSGIVTGPSGLPAQRVVRIFSRASGGLLGEVQSNAGTGAYSFQTAYMGEVNRVVYDDDEGELLNDLIARTTPV